MPLPIITDPLWTTKSRTQIRVSGMTDDHLLNTHRMLCRIIEMILSKVTINIGISSIPLIYHNKVYGSIRWISVLELEAQKRELELLRTMPVHEALDTCVIGWDTRRGCYSLHRISNSSLIRLLRAITNEIRICLRLQLCVGPDEHTAAYDCFQAEVRLAQEREIDLYNRRTPLVSEARLRGIDPIPYMQEDGK